MLAKRAVWCGSMPHCFYLRSRIPDSPQFRTTWRSEQVQANPIELLSLSACQTAEGYDRAPLSIAGAALKAQARSALGCLWQVYLLNQQAFKHSFFWAPFILVGGWQ